MRAKGVLIDGGAYLDQEMVYQLYKDKLFRARFPGKELKGSGELLKRLAECSPEDHIIITVMYTSNKVHEAFISEAQDRLIGYLSSGNANIDKALEIKGITRKGGFIPGEGSFLNSEDVNSIFEEMGLI